MNDAARRLGIPPGTVKSRCHAAIRQLRNSVGPDTAPGLAA